MLKITAGSQTTRETQPAACPALLSPGSWVASALLCGQLFLPSPASFGSDPGAGDPGAPSTLQLHREQPVGKSPSSTPPRPDPSVQDGASKSDGNDRPETMGVIQGRKPPRPRPSKKHCSGVCKEKAGNNPATPLNVGNGSTSSLGHKVVKSQLDGVQGEGSENDQRFGKHDLGKKMKELGLFSLQGRRPVTDMIAAFKYVEGSSREEGNKLYGMTAGVRTRRKGLNLKVARLR